MTQAEKAKLFKSLHVPGNPVILYNAWDPGSVQAIAGQGAKAMALGSHGVANAQGYEDGEQIPLELVLANAKRSVDVTDLPLSLDFETGYGATPEEVKVSVTKALETGVIGFNIEDQKSGADELYSIEEQVERLRAVRTAADEFGVEAFINARTDIAKNTPLDQHDDAMLDQIIERAQAFEQAGADGFFVPLLQDPVLIKLLCESTNLPVNIIQLDDMSIGHKEIAEAGASRISYGPGPYLNMIEWLKSEAQKALS